MADTFDFDLTFSAKGATYDFEDFQITGQPEDDKRWRIVVSRNGSDLGMDILTLESAQGRKRLLDSLLGIHDEERNQIAKALLGITPKLPGDFRQLAAEHRGTIEAERESKTAQERTAQLAELETDVIQLAKNPALLYEASQTIKGLGVAGEKANRPLVYAALTSRVTQAPISIVVKGPSSSGKNNLLGKALEMFQPGEHYIDLTSMSEKALLYDERSYSHLAIIVFEIHGTEQGDYYIRTLQTEGCLKHLTVIDGQSVRIDKPGPTNFLTTTTEAEINPENETRLFSVFVDDSEETTKGAKEIAAKEADGTAERPNTEIWRRFQQWLQLQIPYEVIIPYSSFLAKNTPDKPPRMRRDFRRLLEIVKVTAILYQAQREKDEQGRIVATVADFAMARPLAESLMRQAETGLNPKTRQIAEAVCEIYNDKTNELERWVTYKELIEKTGFTKSTISTWIQPAYEESFLENLEAIKGKKARLVPGVPLRDGAGLPAIEDLARDYPDLAQGTYVDPIAGEETHLLPETVETPETVSGEDSNPYLQSAPDNRSDREKTVETPRDTEAQAQNLSVLTVSAEPERSGSDSKLYLDETDRSNRSNRSGGSGLRTKVLTLAAAKGWPAISLGERDVNNRLTAVGVPAGRSAWEQAIQHWPDDLLNELLTRLETS